MLNFPTASVFSAAVDGFTRWEVMVAGLLLAPGLLDGLALAPGFADGFALEPGAAEASGAPDSTILSPLPFTVTLQTYFFPPHLAVILAVPFFLPFTTPLAVTDAIFFLEDFHFTFFLVFFNFSFTFCPTFMVTFFLLSFTFPLALAPPGRTAVVMTSAAAVMTASPFLQFFFMIITLSFLLQSEYLLLSFSAKSEAESAASEYTVYFAMCVSHG
jgi:hypothetical protein